MNPRRCALLVGLMGLTLPACGAGTPAAPAAATQEKPSMSTPPSMSRPPAPEVKPVVHDGVRYEQDKTDERQGDQPGGYLAAVDAKTGARLWRLKVYSLTAGAPGAPTGGGRHFRSMQLAPGGSALEIVDEAGVRYSVDLTRRSVSQTGGPATQAERPAAKPKPKPE
jgi:hypothetical protein